MGIRKLLFIFSLTFSGIVFSQTKEDVEKITKNYDFEKIKALEVSFRKREANEKKAAYEAAKINNWPIIIDKEDGTFQELMKLTPDGFPVYFSTTNVAAAKSTRTNFLNSGGGLGLALDGQNMVARVWDGGTVRRTHNGFGNRVETVDDPNGSTYSSHATHVTGTIIGSPWNVGSTATKGMASQATAKTFNWTDDESEAIYEASQGMLVSNHSYGIPVTSQAGNTLPAWIIGSYSNDSRVWDEIVYNAPYYLPVFSAGNDGSNNNNPDPLLYGYDKLVGDKVAKNVLTIANADDAVIAVDGSLTSVVINASSSQGPTDDRRIKPDVSGNGTGLLSYNSSSDNATVTYSGTSMAAPNVTGTLLLLQQHYKNVTNTFMKAATLKGLACHTADDAGEVGPDPIFGWGLLNAKKAAETISNNGLNAWISEERINQGQSISMTFKSTGGANNPLKASITWTDVPGEANNGQRYANDPFPALVNDLDIRISKDGTTFFPWKLNEIDFTAPSTRDSDNKIDNVELVMIDNPVAGDYVITITHKGNLVNLAQNFSLVITGVSSNFTLIPMSDNVELCSNNSASYTFNYKQIGLGTTNFTTVGVPTGANVTISPTSLNTNGTITMTLSNLSNVIPGEYNVGILGNNGTETETKIKKLKIFNPVFQPLVATSPSNGYDGASTTINLDWQTDANAESYSLELSLSPTFATILSSFVTPASNYLVSNLLEDTLYYWRVSSKNRCGVQSKSDAVIWSFRTGLISCGNTFNATDFSNSTIATTSNASASVPLEVTGGLTIGEIKVSLNISHTYIEDMSISLQGPASIGSPIIVLFERPCGNAKNINCVLLDSGEQPACIGIPAISGNIAPLQSFSSLNGLPADGTWTLLVKDPYNTDGGVINNFSIEVCALTSSLSTNNYSLNSLKVYPNPTKGIINIDSSGIVADITTYELFDVQGRKVVSKVSSNTIETLNVENLSDGIYMLTVQNSFGKTNKKIVINK